MYSGLAGVDGESKDLCICFAQLNKKKSPPRHCHPERVRAEGPMHLLWTTKHEEITHHTVILSKSATLSHPPLRYCHPERASYSGLAGVACESKDLCIWVAPKSIIARHVRVSPHTLPSRHCHPERASYSGFAGVAGESKDLCICFAPRGASPTLSS
jgi:ribosome modulation factor